MDAAKSSKMIQEFAALLGEKPSATPPVKRSGRFAYPQELKQEVLALARQGVTPAELAQRFDPSEQCIRNWMKAAGVPEVRPQRSEIERLRQEIQALREERTLIMKAAAWAVRILGGEA